MVFYSNSQIRSILNGLGYRSQLDTNDPSFPISQDESDLTDQPTLKAIKKFQIDYNLVVDGIVGSNTSNTMQEEMNVLHDELNQVLGTDLPLDQPFYGQETLSAIQQFQQQLQPDGLASFPVREELFKAVNGGTVQDNQPKLAAA